jgi:hypothetical protein
MANGRSDRQVVVEVSRPLRRLGRASTLASSLVGPRLSERPVRDDGAADVRAAGRAYDEVGERHHRGDAVTVVNSMTVFEFTEDGKISHLDVYRQPAR